MAASGTRTDDGAELMGALAPGAVPWAVAVFVAAAALILGVPVVDTFFHTHKVLKFPTAVLATGLMLIAFVSLVTGLILDTVTRGRKEAKMLRYLAVPGPLAAAGRDPGEVGAA